MPEHRYCIDSSCLITAKNGLAAFDLWPEFWERLERLFQEGLVYMCFNVYDECTDSDDDLASWFEGLAQRVGDNVHLMPTEQVQRSQGEIADFVQSGAYKPAHKRAFLDKADPWLIAQARVDATTVVTDEKAVDETSWKVKIPNVCQHFGVRVITLVDMLRELNDRQS